MIPQQIDLVALIGGNLRKRAGQLVGACPFCGGTDRFYIDLRRNRWGCRGCAIGYNDALAFVARRDGYDLHKSDDMKRAMDALGIVDNTPVQSTKRDVNVPAVSELADYDAFSINFQIPARRFVDTSQSALARSSAMPYLIEKRRLDRTIINEARLGFNESPSNQTWHDRVHLPRGIVIPWFNRGEVWRIRFRTNDPQNKYKQVAGGANALYLTSALKPASIVVLCEGEFDALAVMSAMERWGCRTGWLHPVVAVATGGVTQARVLRHVGLLSVARKVLVAYDSDKPGEDASKFWLGVLPRAVRATPTHHDLNDMVIADVNMARWIQGHLK
jgi:DNA primase